MKRVLWTVNPFELEKGFSKTCLFNLKKVFSFEGLDVVPCHVVVGGDIDHQAMGQNLINREEYRKVAVQELGKKSKNWKGTSAPVILPEIARSQRDAVRMVCDYAKIQGFDAIAVGTHGRSGVARFFLGSFAESMVLSSETPVLVLHPEEKITGKLKNILMATDYSPESKKLFDRAIELAVGLKAKLTVFHQFQEASTLAVSPGVFPAAVGGFTDVHGWLKEERKSIGKISENWAGVAKASGIKAKFINEVEKRSLEDEILKKAKKEEVQLIVMEGESGPLETVLIGSVCRKIVRSSKVPVLVIRKTTLESTQ